MCLWMRAQMSVVCKMHRIELEILKNDCEGGMELSAMWVHGMQSERLGSEVDCLCTFHQNRHAMLPIGSHAVSPRLPSLTSWTMERQKKGCLDKGTAEGVKLSAFWLGA